MRQHLNKIKPVILCGGKGLRLWPYSRNTRPKPFLKPLGRPSLFQQTLTRVKALDTPILVSPEYLDKVLDDQIPQKTTVERIREPEGRNTCAAILLTCLKTNDRKALHLFLPCDHAFDSFEPFLEKLDELASKDETLEKIYLFGIKALMPETRYGYIKHDPESYRVDSFIEKPEKKKAKELFENECWWNSGIILATPERILAAAEKNIPEILHKVQHDFENTPSLSIDKALLEKADDIYVVPLDVQWMDIGTWWSFMIYIFKHKPLTGS
ncbi:MAG: hypothetical protein CL565_03765 [Alphaproteobacteria bacterium]|nr:hypothetical protein [Alphaproteobacteria bacterium]